jgi:hypothetical protein
MTGTNGRVVHKEFGAGEIDRVGLFGNQHGLLCMNQI